ncbi:restriction endonuclease [Pedobacter sp. P351]|uniref:restriction endonuclease n=1 Tax=Pedobacter superstes TaxID=3133441 RepID=UPI00309A9F8C
MIPIYNLEPSDWRDLQNKVAKIYLDLGFNATVEKDIQTARGVVNVDVYCEKTTDHLVDINIVECKYWTSAVPKTIIHSFRSVIADYGANMGLIISKNGFQSGAFEAAKNSNVALLTFDEFQNSFRSRWLESVIDSLEEVGYPLRKYCDPLETFAAREYDKLTREKQLHINGLMKKYYATSSSTMRILYKDVMSGKLMLEYIDNRIRKEGEQLNGKPVTCLMTYFDSLYATCLLAVKEFDEAYGKKLRKWA